MCVRRKLDFDGNNLTETLNTFPRNHRMFCFVVVVVFSLRISEYEGNNTITTGAVDQADSVQENVWLVAEQAPDNGN